MLDLQSIAIVSEFVRIGIRQSITALSFGTALGFGTISAQDQPGDRLIRARLADEWLSIEARDFARLSRELARDEFRERRKARGLEGLISGAVRWSQGGQSAKDRATMRKVFLGIQQSPDLSGILQSAVPALPVSHFHKSSTDLDLLGPNGELPQLPAVLDIAEPSEWARRYTQFDTSWNDVIAVFRSQSQPSNKQLVLLRNRYEILRASANDRLKVAPKLASNVARDHLLTLQRLVLMAEMPANRSPLARCIQTPAFPGGTVADLLTYVFENNLSLEYGSAAQLAVASAVGELTDSMAHQLAQSEDRVERYKAQNPAHNSVLRARLLGVTEIPGTNGGLNSPAYDRSLPRTARPLVAPAAAAQRQRGEDNNVIMTEAK